MVEYSKVNVKLSGLQLNKLKSAVKNQPRATLRMNMKMFQCFIEIIYVMNYY